MQNWFMLTLVGEDQPGIVAAITQSVYEAGYCLGETSMLRLGGNFTIMMMLAKENEQPNDVQEQCLALKALLKPMAEKLSVTIHLDAIKGHLHRHIEPDVRITVHGADRSGIVAQVTAAMAENGLNILDLESDVAGDPETPIYIMVMEGQAKEGMDKLEAVAKQLCEQDISVNIEPIDMMLG